MPTLLVNLLLPLLPASPLSVADLSDEIFLSPGQTLSIDPDVAVRPTVLLR